MAAPPVSAATRVGVAAFALACLAAVRVLLGDGDMGLLLDAALALTAVVATLDAARRARPGRSVVAWRFQTAAAAAWLLAPLAWLTPLPDGVATTGRVACVAFAGSGWVLTSLSSDPWSRVRLVIDSWLAGASVFVVGWTGLFETIVRDRSSLGGALAVALPLATLSAAVVACGVALTEIPPGRRAMPSLLIVALLVIAASDVAHGLGGRPLWAVGWAFFALGTRAYRGTSTRREVISTHRWLVHTPYVVLAPAAISLAVHQLGEGRAPSAELTAAVVMAGLLLVRQQVTLAENAGLVERLATTQLLLRHQATHDALTGLPGRVLLHERLDAAIRDRRSRPVGLAVVFVDLDDFKVVNDTLGHAAGDDVLAQTARRLARVLAPFGSDAAAFRMSGDEFAILLTAAAADDAATIAARLLDALLEPMTVSTHPVTVGGSVGVAVAVDVAGDVDPSALLRAADLAMYDVKHHGKSGVAVAPVVRGALGR